MADFIVSTVVSSIVDGIKGDIYSYIKEENHLVAGVEDDVKNLSSTLTSIQALVQYAEETQLTNKPLRDWLQELKDAASDAEDILDSYKTDAYLWSRKQEAKAFRSPFSTVFRNRDAAQKIKNISATIDMIAEKKSKFHLDVNTVRPTNPELPTMTAPHVNISDVLGREDDKEKIVAMLLSDEDHGDRDLTVIPIIGMGGVGKTTLAQLVLSDERIEKKFQTMWVCVTMEFDLTRILRDMIVSFSKMLQYDINSTRELLESRLLEIIKEKKPLEVIKEQKPFLVVLDDVWTEDIREWEALQGLLKQGKKGSIVLVTSRSIEVSEMMRTEPPYLLSYLADDQCWELFKKFAFNGTVASSEVQTDLEKIGKDIVRKCQGLPLAVKVMGGVLRGNINVNKWRTIMNSEIWKLEKQDTEKDKAKILPALKLSYDHLPSNLKNCFAYCSIFPKGYEFDKKDLVKQWMAHSFIESREQEQLEDTGNEYFDNLLSRSLFQRLKDEYKERYTMHHLIHDLAQSISSPYCHQVKDSNTCKTAENTRYLSILCPDVEQSALKIIKSSHKLRTLLLPSDYLKDLGKTTTLDNLFHAFRYMRVLDLSSSSIVELPEAVEKMKLLRYLDLSKNEIRKLPDSICNLINLQTLKLLGCLWLFELPRDFGNLSNLRHLELDEMFWYKSSKFPSRLGSLTGVRNLHAFRVGSEKGYGIDELKDMVYLMGTLHISDLQNVVNDSREAKLREKNNLDVVVFEWSSSSDVDLQQDHEAAQEKVLEGLQPHSSIKEIEIRHYKGSRFAPWIRDGQLQNLVSVTLIHCTKCRTLSLGRLSCLQQLCIKGMLELEEWQELEEPQEWDEWLASEKQFPSLVCLKISDCPKLKKVPNFFANLGALKIKRCNSLKALAVTLSLQLSILVDNPELEDWHQMSYPFHNLLELKIINCPKFKALPNILFAPQKLEISGCKLLSTLPTTPEFVGGLQHLALGSCDDGKLVRVIPSTSSLSSLVISGISNIIYLLKWPHLPGLKALYIRDCKDLVNLSESEDEEEGSLRSLAALKLLSIRDCPKLEKLSSQGLPTALECLIIGSCPNLKLLGPNEMLKSLTSLKDLYVEECPNLRSLPEDGLSTSLQHFHIRGCPLLSERCRKENGGGPDWPKIEHVPDIDIDYTIMPQNVEDANRQHPKPKSSSSTWRPHFICAGIVFGFVFVVLLAMGVYYVMSTRQANESNTLCPT